MSEPTPVPKPGTRAWYAKYESAPERDKRLARELVTARRASLVIRWIVVIGLVLLLVGTFIRVVS